MSGWSTRTVSHEKKNSPSGTSEERSLGQGLREARTPALRAKLRRTCIARSCLMVMERRFRDWQPSACQELPRMSLWQRGHVSGRELVGGKPRRRRSASWKSRSDRGRCRGEGCSQREVRRSLGEADLV